MPTLPRPRSCRTGWYSRVGVAEAQAATVNITLIAVLTHWAIRDFGAGVLGFDFVTTEGDLCELWLISMPEVADRIAGDCAA